MSLQDRFNEDLKQAIRQGDTVRRSTIRMMKAAIINAEKAQGAALDDTGVLGVIAKQVKQRRESIEAFEQAGREDLVAQEKAELAVLEAYLPQQMTRDEIVVEARRMIEEVGARGPGDRGKVMPRLIAQLKGRAEGKQINEVVTELLGGGG